MSSVETADRLIRIGEVVKMMAVSRATIHRWAAAGLFPKPFSVVPNGAAVWSLKEVNEWIERAKSDRH